MGAAATILSLAGTYVLLFLLERRWPLRRPKAALAHRLLVNAVLSALAFGVAALLVRPAAVETLGLLGSGGFGIVPQLGLAGAGEIAASFLLMDLTFYYWHRANHRIGLL